jgi:hypothetical protein
MAVMASILEGKRIFAVTFYAYAGLNLRKGKGALKINPNAPQG